jgi:hypothetical protein
MQNGRVAPDLDARHTEADPQKYKQGIESDHLLSTLRHALSLRRKALPTIYQKASIFTLLGGLSVWMVTYSFFGLILLRPAQEAGTTHTAELLRPGTSNARSD